MPARHGVTERIRHLDGFGVAHVGAGRDAATAHRPAWFDIAGQRIALLGYDAIRPAYTRRAQAGSAGSSPPTAARTSRAARKAGADVVVVLPHWGVEYTAATTASQRANARALAAAGATLVLGSHSHWAGAMETVDGRRSSIRSATSSSTSPGPKRRSRASSWRSHSSGPRPIQIRLHPTVSGRPRPAKSSRSERRRGRRDRADATGLRGALPRR